MALQDFLTALRRESMLLVGAVLLVMVGGGLWLFSQPVHYYTSVSLTSTYIDRDGQEDRPNDFFKFDNYYGIQVAQSYNETIASLLKNEGVVYGILNQAGYDTSDLKAPSRFFSTLSRGRHVSEIRFVTASSEEAEQIANALSEDLQARAEAFNQTDEGRVLLSFEPHSIVQEDPTYAVMLAVLLIVGLGLGVLTAVTATYIRDQPLSAEEIANVFEAPLLSRLSLHQMNQNPNHTALLLVRDALVAEARENGLRIGLTTTENLEAAVNGLLQNLESVSPGTFIQKDHRQSNASTLLESLKKTKVEAGQIATFWLPALNSAALGPNSLHQFDRVLILLPEQGLGRKVLQTLGRRLQQAETKTALVVLG